MTYQGWGQREALNTAIAVPVRADGRVQVAFTEMSKTAGETGLGRNEEFRFGQI